MSTSFRIRYSLLGGHVHCDVFVAKDPQLTHAKSGTLVFDRGAEFRDFVHNFKQADFRLGANSQGDFEACCTEA